MSVARRQRRTIAPIEVTGKAVSGTAGARWTVFGAGMVLWCLVVRNDSAGIILFAPVLNYALFRGLARTGSRRAWMTCALAAVIVLAAALLLPQRVSPDAASISSGAGQPNSAVPAADRAASAEIDALYATARQQAKQGDYDAEMETYGKILARNPQHPEANYCMAMNLFQRRKDRDGALKHLKTARDALPAGNAWRDRCDELINQLERMAP